MATISLLSAKGAPGVTTVAVGISMAWPGAVPGRAALCVDADPVGGDTAGGVLRGALPTAAGMLSLATSRGVRPVDAIDAASVQLHADGTTRLLAGVPDAARAAALGLAWDTIVQAREELAASGTDVLVDAGRVDLSRPPAPWLLDSDLAILLVRPTLPAVAAAHRLASDWAGVGAPTSGIPMGLVVVEAPSAYRPREVAGAVGLDLVGVIPFDPASARVHSEGADPARGFVRSGYVRALARLAGDLAGMAVVPEPFGDHGRTAAAGSAAATTPGTAGS
jgi:MinD-like ATPase involved in chromosome partitioning or flagellar assembly